MTMFKSSRVITVLPTSGFCAVNGVAHGDPLDKIDMLVFDDVYARDQTAATTQLYLTATDRTDHYALPDGRIVHLEGGLTFITPNGCIHETVLLAIHHKKKPATRYIFSINPLCTGERYRLIASDTQAGPDLFMQAFCGSIAQGTHITMANGTTRPIEDLKTGDHVLTRDAGPKPIRAISHTVLRAQGAFAPIVISKGVLQNKNDLLLRPEQRISTQQQIDRPWGNQHQTMVKVQDLIDGAQIYQRSGGFVAYYHLLLDGDYIIYADGVCTESQSVDPNSPTAEPQRPVWSHDHQTPTVTKDTAASYAGQAAKL